MRPLLIFVCACGGGAIIAEPPAASIASVECSRLGPDGTGFLIEGQYNVSLETQQAFEVVAEFPTGAPPINRNDIYNCGAWSSFSVGDIGDPRTGCQRPIMIGGDSSVSQQVGHSLAIEFPDPLPPTVTVTVRANPLATPESTAPIGLSDSESVSCD